MASQLEDIGRIFQDISNHSSKVKSVEICNGLDANHELQLQKHKVSENHLASLKTMLIRLQTQSHFMESMAKENWSSTDCMEMTEHQANVRKESKDDKQTIEQLEADIDELAETLCTKHKVLKEKLELLEQRLASTKDKKNKYEMLKGKLEEMAGKLDQQENREEDSFNELEAKQSEAAMNIEQCKAAIVSVEHCIGLLQVEASHLQGSVNEVLEDFRKRVSMKQECYQHEQAHRQWLAGAVELYSNLGGVTVQSMQGDSVVLLIQSDAQPGDEPGTPLILTIRFRLEGGVHVVFAGAEVNLDALNIKDLVDQAIHSKGDVVGFILEVKRRFRNQRSLVKEIEELQANYAMDWEPSQGRIRVMLGKSGKIVCNLKVDPMYCTGGGNIELLGVEGSSDHTGLQNLQSDGSSRNLTEWITDLQKLFNSQ